MECFDFGMVNAANLLIQRGLLKPAFYFNLLLGYSVPTVRHPANLLAETFGRPLATRPHVRE